MNYNNVKVHFKKVTFSSTTCNTLHKENRYTSINIQRSVLSISFQSNNAQYSYTQIIKPLK